MLIIRNITYKIESFLYSLFLPLHLVNTWGTESVKLFHVPVVLMGLFCIATLPKYLNITAVKWLIGFIGCFFYYRWDLRYAVFFNNVNYNPIRYSVYTIRQETLYPTYSCTLPCCLNLFFPIR